MIARSRVGSRAFLAVAGALTAAALTVLPGASAHALPAPAQTWLPAERIEPGQAALTGLSCGSPTFCAASSVRPIVADGGPPVEPGTNPDPGAGALTAVSCAPGSRFCMFVDSSGGAFTMSDGSFGSVDNIDGATPISSVSCVNTAFCVAVDNVGKVFKWDGSWDAGLTLVFGAGVAHPLVSCSAMNSCVAIASTSAGERWSGFNGAAWSASAALGSSTPYAVSLTCTSSSICLATGSSGWASTFSSSTWTSPVTIDSINSTPLLHSSCVATSCVAVDFFGNAFTSSNGTTWSGAVNIKASTGIGGVQAVTCQSATLCMAGDTLGSVTTYADPPNPGKPALAGSGKVGQPLALSHAGTAEQSVWFADDWRRCAQPGSACTGATLSRSQSGYTPVAADAGGYVEVRETVGFGLYQSDPLISNPVLVLPGVASRSGAATAKRSGKVMLNLQCTGGPCSGKAELTKGKKTYASAAYSIPSGASAKVALKLSRVGKRLFKAGHYKLKVVLVLQPSTGSATSEPITLKASRPQHHR